MTILYPFAQIQGMYICISVSIVRVAHVARSIELRRIMNYRYDMDRYSPSGGFHRRGIPPGSRAVTPSRRQFRARRHETAFGEIGVLSANFILDRESLGE